MDEKDKVSELEKDLLHAKELVNQLFNETKNPDYLSIGVNINITLRTILSLLRYRK